MTIPTGAYSDTDDLLHGDIRLPDRHGDGTGIVKSAAEDIDIQIGHIYVTPVTVNSDVKYNRTRVLLKKMNNYIASGRLILDMAAPAEDDQLHAYGLSLLREGQELLRQVRDGAIPLEGATVIDGDDSAAPVRAIILNEDPSSLVESFYRRTNGQVGIFEQPALPYGERVL